MNKDIKKLAEKYVKYKLNWVNINDNAWEAESCYWRDNGESIMYRIERKCDEEGGEYFANKSDKELITDENSGGFGGWENVEELKTILQNDNYENVIAILLEQLISK